MAYIWKEDTTFLPIIYFWPLYKNYIEMVFFFKTSKWESWNSQIMNILILQAQIFFTWTPIKKLLVTKL